jgi:RNA polymerase sigma factor (TIGR02999 family)
MVLQPGTRYSPGNPATDGTALTVEITQLLIAHGAGDSGALDRLVPLVYDDLRRLARVQLRRRGGVETLNTGGLVNEAYLRLIDQTRASWRDRGHFFAVCAIAMRQIVVDHARRRARQKRGGDQAAVPLDEARDAASADAARILEIDLALRKLAETDRKLAAIVECRYFAGLTDDETALALGMSVRTAQREWFKARAWLRHELAGDGKA